MAAPAGAWNSGCAIWSLPPEDVVAAVDAAQDRLAAFTAGLNSRLRERR
jgi:hypothetical protein